MAEQDRGSGFAVRGSTRQPGQVAGAVPDPEPLASGPDPREEPPPIGRSWGALYAIVAGALLLWIVLFFAFTRAFQ
ncbi:MAG: hypothetical protein ACHQQS_04885 [Thermoanaerobaculales bacterium]